jgi:WD40 repeat protein
MSEAADGSRDGAGAPDVFVSYSRADEAFVRRLDGALRARGKDVWVDWDDIPATADWRARIHGGIEASRIFVAVLSPDLVASEVCAEELAHATRSNKRVVPVLRREIDRGAAPDALVSPNWIFFRDGDDFERSVGVLVEALETDLDWLEAHARLLVRATEWDVARRSSSFLLRGEDLKEAEAWLAEQGSHREAATPLQSEFIVASRRSAARRLRLLLAGVLVALAVAVVLGIVALLQRNAAIDESEISRSRELAATAVSQLPTDPELGLLLAREAVRVRETPQAEAALLRALRESHLRLTLGEGTGPVTSAWFSADGRRVVSAAGTVATVWNVRTGKPVARLEGHRRALRGARFSPDGRRVVTASDDRTARLWDSRTGEPLATLRHRDVVTDAVFSPDGLRVATASDDGRAGLWDARTGAPIAFVGRTPGADVTGLAWSRVGSRLVTTTHDGYVLVWDGRTGERVRAILGNPLHSPVYTPSLNPSGTEVAVASWDDARVWSVTSGKLVKRIQAHALGAIEIYVHDTDFSRDGRYLVTSGVDGTAKVWSAPGWAQLASLVGHSGGVQTAEFSRDGSRVLTHGSDGTARVWDSFTGESVAVLRVPGGTIRSAAFAPDGNRVVTATDDGLRVWEASGFVPVRRITPPRDAPRDTDAYLTDAIFDADGGVLATVGNQSVVRLWRVANGRHVTRLRGEGAFQFDPGGRVAFSPDGTRAVTAGPEWAFIWDARSGEELARLRQPDGTIRLAFSLDGRRVLTTGGDGRVRVWDASDGTRLRMLKVAAPGDQDAHVAFTPDGRTVAVSTPRGVVLREVETAQRRRIRNTAGGALAAPAFSADGTLLYLSTGNDAARYAAPGARTVAGIWDVETGARVAVLRGAGNLGAGLFSRDGRLLLTRDADTARVWDVATGEGLATIRGHRASNVGSVASASFSPDGRLVITSGADGITKLWDSRTGERVGLIRPLPSPEGFTISAARFSPRGDLFATTAIESIYLYRCEECGSPETLRRLADARLARTVTQRESERLALLVGGR